MNRGASESTAIVMTIVVTIVGIISILKNLLDFFIKYIAPTAAVIIVGGLIVWILYLTVQYFFIGSINNNNADPMLKDLALWSAERGVVSVSDIIGNHVVPEERAKFIFMQMRLAGIIGESGKTLDSKWKLGPIFRRINTDSSFFIHQIESYNNDLVSIIKLQIYNEKNVNSRRLLNLYKFSIGELEFLSYYYQEKQSCLAYNNTYRLGIVNEAIDLHEKLLGDNYEKIVLDEQSKSKYDRICSNLRRLNQYSIWNKWNQKVKIEQRDFFHACINGNVAVFPSVSIDENLICLFLPHYIILHDRSSCRFIKCFEYKQLKLLVEPMCSAKANWFDKQDVQVAYYTYRYTRVDGQPDRRYKNNPATPHYQFFKLTFQNTDFELTFADNTPIDILKNCISQLGNLSIVTDNHDSLKPNKQGDAQRKTQRVAPKGLEDISERIATSIRNNHLSEETIRIRTLAYILNDLQVFQTVEEKSYFRIMKSLIGDGILEKIMVSSPDSLEGKRMVDNYAMSSGYDLEKVRSVVMGVYYGFVDSANA